MKRSRIMKVLPKVLACVLIVGLGISECALQFMMSSDNASVFSKSSNYAKETETATVDNIDADRATSKTENGLSQADKENSSKSNSNNSSGNGKLSARVAQIPAVGDTSQGSAVTNAVSEEDIPGLGTIKYLPITMYNYDADIYNPINNQKELEEANGEFPNKWHGFYFNDYYEDLNDGAVQVKDLFDADGNLNIEDGKYILRSARSGKSVAIAKDATAGGVDQILSKYSFGEYSEWIIRKTDNGNYTLQAANGMYMSIGDNSGTLSEEPIEFEIGEHRPVTGNGNNVLKEGVADAVELRVLRDGATPYAPADPTNVEELDANYFPSYYWLNEQGDFFRGWYWPDEGAPYYLYKIDTSAIYETEQLTPTFDGENAIIEDGDYLIYGNRAGFFVNAGISEDADDYGEALIMDSKNSDVSDVFDTTIWTIKSQGDGTYTVQDEQGRYISMQANNNKRARLSETQTVCYIKNYNQLKLNGQAEVNNAVIIQQNNVSLNDYGGTAIPEDYYQGTQDVDEGNALILYKVDKTNQEYIGLVYDDWNQYTGGAILYDGIVEDTLDVNKNIQFKHVESGVFDTNNKIKDIYTNVGMPFIYENGTYTFDSNRMSARFADGPQNDLNLTVDVATQRRDLGNGNDESIWMPYNTELGTITNPEYHFGMTATIPFTMSENGRVKMNDDESDPIEFSFSGDDDIWIFIDGHLVLDLGGIHDRVGANLNFATNTWKIEGDATYKSGAAKTGSIFNDDANMGKINQTIKNFAATENHELTIFYLERGLGSSNCRISFNFPMKDTVSITKKVDQSITKDGQYSPLSDKELEIINNVDFMFTLYKNDGSEAVPVANANYSVLNSNGQTVANRVTDATGQLVLRNGQTARFIDELSQEGVTYYVVENDTNGFSKTKYTYDGSAGKSVTDENGTTAKTGGFYEGDIEIDLAQINQASQLMNNDKDTTIKSKEIKVVGDDETDDSLQFICENFYDASMELGTVHPGDDVIVIDYGLGVNITPLANDLYRGESIRLKSVSDGQYGKATASKDVINYQLNQPLSDIETLNYVVEVTYKNGEEVLTKDFDGKVYIIPATSMYYEEDFGMDKGNNGMVTYTNGKSTAGWKVEGTPQQDYQEPGVVGTTADSPYGSDRAYLTDGGDSNGSSRYVNTEKGAAQFSYSFTGTGTAFFARTNNTAAYMRVILSRESRKNLLKDTQWTTYIGSDWTESRGTLTQKSNNIVGNFTKIGKGNSPNPAEDHWGIQTAAEEVPVTAGHEYTYSAVLTADKDMIMRIKVGYANNDQISLDTVTLKAGESYKYTTTFTPARDAVNITYALGATTDTEVVENVRFTLSNHRLVDNNDTEKAETETIETVFRNNIYKNDTDTLYNIPVYNIEDLEYDTYTVTVTISKKILNYGYEFWLDGIRVYNPLGTGEELVKNYPMANGAYSTDGEANNTVVTLRDKLLKDVTSKDENGSLNWTDGNNFVLFTDEYGAMQSADEYKSFGPKEEVYLNNGQSISFSLVDWDPNTNKAYIGMKAPKGTGVVDINNGTKITLNNAADCYYVINPTISEKEVNGKIVKVANFLIEAEEGSLISLTNIKVTGTAKFAIYENN